MFYFSGLPSTYHKTKEEALKASESATAGGSITEVHFSNIKIKPSKYGFFLNQDILSFSSKKEMFDFISFQKESLFLLIEQKEELKKFITKQITHKRAFLLRYKNLFSIDDATLIFEKEEKYLDYQISELRKILNPLCQISPDFDEETILLELSKLLIIYFERQ